MADLMMKLVPWTVPSHARLQGPPRSRQEGLKEAPSVAVEELPQEALDAMAGEWLIDLYAKAGKPIPWSAE